MSREILDCLKRKQDICIKNIIPSQNTAFMCTPALKEPFEPHTQFFCNKVREDIVRLIIYTWAGVNFWGILLLRQVSPCLLRGSLAYIFSGLLILIQYIECLWKKMCPKFLAHRGGGGDKGFRNLLWVNFARKTLILQENNKLAFLSDLKMLLLTAKIGKAYIVCNSFLFTRSTKFPSYFQTWSQNSRMLIAFFRSEIAKHASDVMTQTRIRQTSRNCGRFP